MHYKKLWYVALKTNNRIDLKVNLTNKNKWKPRFSQSEKRPEMKNNKEGKKREIEIEMMMIGDEETIVKGWEIVRDIERETMDTKELEKGKSIGDEMMKRGTMSMGKCY